MDLNKTFILGRVTADPQQRTTPSGQSVTTIGVATNRVWTDKNNQKQEETEFHSVVLWGRQAEIAGQYLTKGSTVLIEGRLQTRSWTDKNGGARKTTEIVAERLQLGPAPMKGATTPAAKAAPAQPKAPEEHLVPLDGEEEPGRHLTSAFGEEEEEIKPEEIPF